MLYQQVVHGILRSISGAVITRRHHSWKCFHEIVVFESASVCMYIKSSGQTESIVCFHDWQQQWQMTQCLASKRTGQVKAGREVQSRLREHGVWWAMHGYRPFLSWLSILVTGTGNRNNVKSRITMMSFRKISRLKLHVPLEWHHRYRWLYTFQLPMPVCRYGQQIQKGLQMWKWCVTLCLAQLLLCGLMSWQDLLDTVLCIHLKTYTC